MPKTDNVAIVREYFDHLLAGRFDAIGKLFAPDIVWHQGGASNVSGTYRGLGAVFEHLGRFMKLSQGSFRIDKVNELMGNGDLVAAHLAFSARRDGRSIAMNGVDVLRVDGGTIREVWLFSADQAAEDGFWNAAVEAESRASQ